jgi:large subunit ribosomal protein L21
MYAIVKTGGKQYRVEPGQTLLVERLPQDEGATVMLEPLLVRSEDAVFDAAGLASLEVQATIVGHLRGPKLRVFKFKPKRGYRRRTGHRQELTRIEVTRIGTAGKAADAAGAKPQPDAPKPAAARKQAAVSSATAVEQTAEAKPAPARKPAARRTATAAHEQSAEAEPTLLGGEAATPDAETAKAKPRASTRSKQAAPAQPDAAPAAEEDTDGA